MHANADVALFLIDRKVPVTIDAGKESPPKGSHECRVRFAAGNVDALAPTRFIIPLNGDAVRRVFRPQAEDGGHSARPQIAETDEANPRHAPPAYQSWLERRRQGLRQDVRSYSKVDEQAAPNHTLDGEQVGH